MQKSFQPKQYQQEWDWRSKVKELSSVPTSDSVMDVDVLFVGAGPAGLSGAIRLKQLCQKDFPNIQIAVLEKASKVGGHSLSGAVINPVALSQLFPEVSLSDMPFRQKVQTEKLFYLTPRGKWPLPLPPTMKNKNFYTASLGEVLRWMAQKAEAMGVLVFPSFTADELLIEGKAVKGVSTFPLGLNKDGSKGGSYQAPVFIRSQVTVLAEGTRGHLSQTWMKWKNISSHYPQTYALGVKEVWEVPSGVTEGEIWHTMGWPLSADCFGGAWMYPLGEGLLSLGLVAGLDSSSPCLDVHGELQKLKSHPLFYRLLEKGKCVEWGAKTIPEGGWHGLPEVLHDEGLLIAGDAAGMVNVPALKGIHYAMTAGICSAETAFGALKQKDFSRKVLKGYDKQVREESCIGKELYPVRNVRQAFEKNIFLGLVQSGLMFLTKGVFPGDFKKEFKSDAEKIRQVGSSNGSSVGGSSVGGSSVGGADSPTASVGGSSVGVRAESSVGGSSVGGSSVGVDSVGSSAGSSATASVGVEAPRHKLAISKLDGVYLSGNKTRDDIPSHLKVKEGVPEEVQDFYVSLCPAGVYEKKDGKLIVNSSNCVDCKATDVLGPRWTPREGGSGPRYQKM